MATPRFHGALPRGFNLQLQSPSFEGRFGRMFRTLPAAQFGSTQEENFRNLELLAAAMLAAGEANQTSENDIDNEENQGIDAGYTYLGQFIDHDLTFDPASSLQKQNDPNGIVDYRTPRFDLDSVYGRGPDDQPYLYQADGIHLLLGRALSGNPADSNARDVPRNTPDPLGLPPNPYQPSPPARALISDPRNDENVIISQLHSSMLRFHNRVVDYLRQQGQNPTFQEVQQVVRWHYQWVILHDFLPTIAGQEVINQLLPHLATDEKDIYAHKPQLKFFHWKENPYIPIEFAAAVYRFGHSMVRPIYRLNPTLTNPDRFSIFSQDENTSLVGFRAFPSDWAIDWKLFFNEGNAPQVGPNRIQKSYKIDTSLVNPLGLLPDSVQGAIKMPSLAERNLKRGWSMGLPSGQAIAKYMHLPIIDDDALRIGKATAEDSPFNKKLVDISDQFKGNAPLWYYILAEAQYDSFDGRNDTAIKLGPVGRRIVAEVIIGILLGDQFSYLSQNPGWQPIADFCRNQQFRMTDLLHQASQAV